MRKKEQAQREQIKVKEIADVIEDVLQGEPTGKKFYDKIKDRIDKAIRKLKININEPLPVTMNIIVNNFH